MCGRYSFGVRKSTRLTKLVAQLAARGVTVKTDEVAPGDITAVVTTNNHGMALTAVKWGFPGFGGGRPLINARAETLLTKPTFHDAFMHQRCVFPMTGFFEWNDTHERYLFRQPDDRLLFVAGFIRQFDVGVRSIIITTAPDAAVGAVHDRMPLLVDEQHVHDWLMDDQYAERLLTVPMADLVGSQQKGPGDEITLDLN